MQAVYVALQLMQDTPSHTFFGMAACIGYHIHGRCGAAAVDLKRICGQIHAAEAVIDRPVFRLRRRDCKLCHLSTSFLCYKLE
jgi:hypothetical protein